MAKIEKKWYEIADKTERKSEAVEALKTLAPDFEKFEEMLDYGKEFCLLLKLQAAGEYLLDSLKKVNKKDKENAKE